MSVYRYRQFRKVLRATPFKGTLMPYEWSGLPKILPAEWMAYYEMCDEFSREIANSVNDFSRFTHQLAAWRDVVARVDENGRMKIANEFVNPLATIAINLPNVIRSRYMFAVAHLCHQANRATQKEKWKDDLPLDHEIQFEQADAYGSKWKNYTRLKTSVERIGNRAYQAATGNFRNMYNHRFSPHVVHGQTQIVTRTVDAATKTVNYSYGGRRPLTLEHVVKLLAQQNLHCYEAFENFQKLVREQELAVISTIVSSE